MARLGAALDEYLRFRHTDALQDAERWRQALDAPVPETGAERRGGARRADPRRRPERLGRAAARLLFVHHREGDQHGRSGRHSRLCRGAAEGQQRVGQRRSGARSQRRKTDSQVERPDS